MCDNFEKLLGFHCAPTLMGIKPASLICCAKEQFSSLNTLIHDYNACFHSKGIVLEALWETEKRVMILVYQKKALSEILADEKIMTFLKPYGYPDEIHLAKCLSILKANVKKERGFPHEIGIFLGYPIEDVEGFIANNGKNCQACGYWKVYADPETKLKIFKAYTSCRERLCRLLSRGITMTQLVSAGI